MIHKIILWVCGIASIIGIILYIIDKTTENEFSKKITLSLILGGFIAAILLALTEPTIAVKGESQKYKNEIENNTNSPISNTIQNQNNHYYSSPSNRDKLEKLKRKNLQDALNEMATLDSEIRSINGLKDMFYSARDNFHSKSRILDQYSNELPESTYDDFFNLKRGLDKKLAILGAHQIFKGKAPLKEGLEAPNVLKLIEELGVFNREIKEVFREELSKMKK